MDKDRGERFFSSGINGMGLDDGKCDLCKHVHEGGFTCEAFPNGIPSEILRGKFDHSEP
ncbi:MAG: hypothetical protein K9K76_07670 [Halanaerobiales bacterium]|nr:hypothetical protein [Halanaerobiales bacterium]